MIGLETDRLLFRQWQLGDHQIFAKFYSNDKNAKYVGGVKKPEDAWRLMATYIGHYHLKGYSYPAILEKESKRLIGTVGLWKSDAWPEHELGYWLLPDSQGKGYGTEAGRAVIQYAREHSEFTSLVSYIDPSNIPSIKLASLLGASYDKTIELLEYGPHAIYRYW